MKYRSVYLIALLILCHGLLGCEPPSPTPTPIPTPDGLNLLIDTQGAVELQRRGWPDYMPASFGAEVQHGDLIRPAAAQPIQILCADFSLQTIAQEEGLSCTTEERSILLYGQVPVLMPRVQDTNDQQLPYILHPRRTIVLDTQPLLHWNDTGADSYTVTILQDGRTIWQQSGVQSNQMRYTPPDNASTLKAGPDYLLVVTDENSSHRSSDESTPNLGFQVLPAEEQKAAQARQQQILALPINEPAQYFVLAIYYSGLELHGDALAQLDQISPTLNTPHIHLWRSDILLIMQLANEAQNAYQSALESAKRLEDKESQALAQTGLWRVTNDESHFNEAIQIYQALDDKNAIERLKAEKVSN